MGTPGARDRRTLPPDLVAAPRRLTRTFVQPDRNLPRSRSCLPRALATLVREAEAFGLILATYAGVCAICVAAGSASAWPLLAAGVLAPATTAVAMVAASRTP